LSILELKAERARVFEQMKALAETAKNENREMTQDEQDTWERMNLEVDTLAAQVSNAEKEERLQALWASLDEKSAKRSSYSPRTPSEIFLDEARALMAGDSRFLEIKFSADEKRTALQAATTPGSYTVPVDFVRTMREYLIDFSGIRQTNVTVMTTESGDDIRIPRATTHPTATLIGETSQITESEQVLGQVTLQAYKYANLQYLSSEFLADEVVNILDYLARQNGIAIANATGADFITGDGTGKPNGIQTAVSAGVTAATGNTTSITADYLIDLYHAVGTGYRKNSYWLMKDATVAAVRKLKETSNQYLWQPGLQAGQPDTLLGRPVIVDPNMPAMGASEKSILFGDFSGYYIRDVGSIRIERSNDFKFDTDVVTFRTIMRTDGDLIDANCVKAYENSAA
jgi:HK97 family phage major capsid protein